MLISSFLTSSNKNKSQNNSGFTLIEILIVISVMAVLSTALLTYSQTMGRQLETVTTVGKIEALIARAKALSIQTYFDDDANSRICAYGIYVDRAAQTISIYQDIHAECPSPKDGSNWLDGYGYDGEDVLLTGETSAISLINLDVEIIVGGDSDLNSVSFVPPIPETVINGEDQTTSAEIKLSDPEGTFYSTITITNEGKVSYGFE